jgi:SAM-dependent methyltransferase
MSDAAERHRQQIEAWNGPMGQQWAANEARTERNLTEVTQALLRAANPQPGERVLDVGCGCGGSSVAFAAAVGPTGHVLGADVSAPMVAVAKATALPQAAFVLADAAAYDFAPASFDLLVSRFGVMFFGDPAAAFANLRRAMKPGGRVAMACWRPVAENPWVRVPMGTLRAVLPTIPPPAGPEDPGPFAFGDPARVTRILTEGGFAAPAFAKFDFDMVFPADPAVAANVIMQMGPAGRIMREQTDEVRASALKAITDAIAPFQKDGRIAMGGAIWLITATAT